MTSQYVFFRSSAESDRKPIRALVVANCGCLGHSNGCVWGVSYYPLLRNALLGLVITLAHQCIHGFCLHVPESAA